MRAVRKWCRFFKNGPTNFHDRERSGCGNSSRARLSGSVDLSPKSLVAAHKDTFGRPDSEVWPTNDAVQHRLKVLMASFLGEGTNKLVP
jgi:hypothetical protein